MLKKGIPISPGIVVARAYCVDTVLAQREPNYVDQAAVSTEIAHFDSASAAASQQLDAIIARVTQQLGEEEASIFRAHRLLVRDPALVGKVKSAILQKRLDARSALHEVLEEYSKLFTNIADEYLRERMADIRDVIGRILAQLVLSEAPVPTFAGDEVVILVAPELLPSQAILLQKYRVAGILTEMGGSTGHAAILSRSMGIPSVSGLSEILRSVATGDLLAIDGREGHVYIKPDAEVEAAYRKLQREYVNLRDRLFENRDQEAITLDGTCIELLANVNNTNDAEMAGRTGAIGVGLYRTEYLFLTHPAVPSEDEQLDAYRKVIEASPRRSVTIRTLDLGGDKVVPYFGHSREANPFMGWRSIRLSTTYPDFFLTQLRAIHRAAVHGNVSLMFPMISTLEEVRHLKRMVRRTRNQLKREGVAFRDELPMGVMMEVPAAALCIQAILEEVDFISIGSNDLIQYVMAADRDNPKVAHLCDPFSPPIFKLLRHILHACNRANKPVTLCGEMAARPNLVLALMGMGLRRLSMSPAFVPTIKELVRCSTLANSQHIARRALRLKTFKELRRYLRHITTKVCPNISGLDTRK